VPFAALPSDGDRKIGQGLFLARGFPAAKSHAGFVQFLRFLGHVRQEHRERMANLFSFNRFADFQNWLRSSLPIAYDLERLAPDLAQDGPNPEYPWPHAHPMLAPVSHKFAVWSALTTGQGRDLMRIIHIAVDRFPAIRGHVIIRTDSSSAGGCPVRNPRIEFWGRPRE